MDEVTMNNTFNTYSKPSKENTPFLTEPLSVFSFVEYECFKLKGTEVVWINDRYLDENNINRNDIENSILENYSYVTKSYAEDEYLDMNDKKTFLTDRYGNQGDAGNGGSARCGINGNFQIKGNGVNPLVSINVDEGHSSGKLPLSEAISESIWSEICNKELPFGALRIIAIIKTQQTITTANTFGDIVEQPCAIIIRELALRPAHYEPANHFWPRQSFSNLRNSTHLYVKDSVRMLENKVERSFIDDENPIYSYLKNFLKKFATQIAVSRVKGIPHGSLTSSNISLDGRFLDLGTISAIDDFSNVVLTTGLGATWHDHYGISEWLWNFFYHLDRNSQEGISKDRKESLIKLFNDELEKQENIHTAIESGVSSSIDNLDNIGEIIKSHLRKGKEHVTRLADCSFNRDKFENEVYIALSKVGYESSKPIFKYRYKKYSRFTIFSSPVLMGMCGSRTEIESFIEAYLGQ